MSAPTVSPRTTGWSSRDRERERELLAKLQSTPPDSTDHMAARDELVTMHLPLVEHIARRFRQRGEAHDDLVQVGTIGLIKAVDRFDPTRGFAFSTYATPTIVGEIKRHFRDQGWSIKVPRRLQDLRMRVGAAAALLSQQIGRSPTVRELARHLEVDEDDVLEALECSQAYSTLSLDTPLDRGDDSGSTRLVDRLVAAENAFDGIDNRESLRPLLAKLPDRERQILMLRFFNNQTQAQIASKIGVSQVHVSRLLAKALATLRDGLMDDGSDGDDEPVSRD